MSFTFAQLPLHLYAIKIQVSPLSTPLADNTWPIIWQSILAKHLSRKELPSCSIPRSGPQDETSSLATSHHLCMLEVPLSTLSALVANSFVPGSTYLREDAITMAFAEVARKQPIFLQARLLKHGHSEHLEAWSCAVRFRSPTYIY